MISMIGLCEYEPDRSGVGRCQRVACLLPSTRQRVMAASNRSIHLPDDAYLRIARARLPPKWVSLMQDGMHFVVTHART